MYKISLQVAAANFSTIFCRKRKRDYLDDPNKSLRKKPKISDDRDIVSHIDDDFEVIKEGSTNILTYKRIRKEAKHKDDAYFKEVKSHKKSCGKKGGFIKDSGYHYDREF